MERMSLNIAISFMFIIGSVSLLIYENNGLFQTLNAQDDVLLNNDSSLQTNETELLPYKTVIVQLLADQLETKLNKSAAILEIASTLPQISTLPNASLIDPSLHGIPKDADIVKRQIAQNILSVDKDFERIFYILPNGDMYFEEPYFKQENLTINNFAFRDYFKGAISTGQTYLGNVVISPSSGLPNFNIAVPLYSDKNSGNTNNTENLIGLFAGDQGLSTYYKLLQSLSLPKNEIAVYVDSNGQVISSSVSLSDISNQNQFDFRALQSFKDVMNNKSGHNIEKIDGKDRFIVYAPIKFKSTIWGVLLIS
ncbi:MAG: hypothetical protein DA328_04700 [Nitrososphaeraceae archaeon]|nr:hypothetical protein [Nitrososphaeraceae archaeon]